MTLLAAFQALLHRYTGQDDIAVGTPIANRTRAEIEGLIGFFVNTLVLRTDLSGDPTFRELLARVREIGARAPTPTRTCRSRSWWRSSQPERDPSRTPLFQVMFALENAPEATCSFAGLTREPARRRRPRRAKFDLTLSLVTEAASGSARRRSSTAPTCSTPRRSRGCSATSRRCSTGIVADPDRPISELPLLDEEERRQLLVDWNDTRRRLPARRDRPRAVRGAGRARRPDAIARRVRDATLTLRGARTRAPTSSRITLRGARRRPRRLRSASACERSSEMIVGAARRSSRPAAPTCRSTRRIRPSGWRSCCGTPACAAARHAARPRDPSSRRTTAQRSCARRRTGRRSRRQPANTRRRRATPRDLAYVMYTSGSTGRPRASSSRTAAIVRLVRDATTCRRRRTTCSPARRRSSSTPRPSRSGARC